MSRQRLSSCALENINTHTCDWHRSANFWKRALVLRLFGAMLARQRRSVHPPQTTFEADLLGGHLHQLTFQLDASRRAASLSKSLNTSEGESSATGLRGEDTDWLTD